VFHYLDAWLPLQQRLIRSMTMREENYESLLLGILDMSRFQPTTELDGLIGVHSNFREQENATSNFSQPSLQANSSTAEK
jgi:hypothetical protein